MVAKHADALTFFIKYIKIIFSLNRLFGESVPFWWCNEEENKTVKVADTLGQGSRGSFNLSWVGRTFSWVAYIHNDCVK